MPTTYTIGLTGGIASGKGLVSKILQTLGATIIDADKIARHIVSPGEKAYIKIKTYWPQVIKENGNIDRKELASIVFSAPAELARLNQATHPYIIEEIKKKLAAAKTPVRVIVAPLLLEVNLQQQIYMDEIWLVYLDETTRIQRLMDRNHLSYQDAIKRIASQLPLNKKLADINRIILNTKDPDYTRKQVEKAWEEIQKRIKA